MTHGDPRGPNIIPFPKRSIEERRTRASIQFTEQPWPFNCFTSDGAIKPWPDKPATLPPVDADRFVRARADTLEAEIEHAIDRYSRRHPDVTAGQIILALVSICKDLAKAIRLPPR